MGLLAGAAVGDPSLADGTADGLLGAALILRRCGRIQFLVQPSVRRMEQLLKYSQPGRYGLLDTVFPQCGSLGEGIHNEGAQPRRKAIGEWEFQERGGHDESARGRRPRNGC